MASKTSFATQDEIIFMKYDEVIKNPYPFILKQIRKPEYRKFFSEFLSLELLDDMTDAQLMRIAVQRTVPNIFEYISKKPFDYETSLKDIYGRFEDMFACSDLLAMGEALHVFMKQKFTKKIYVYNETYDARQHIDLERCFSNMDIINYVTGDFDEVIQGLEGVTSYILNDIMDVATIVHFEKAAYTNILIGTYGYNYFSGSENESLALRINLEDLAKEKVFKFAAFAPYNFTENDFEDLKK